MSLRALVLLVLITKCYSWCRPEVSTLKNSNHICVSLGTAKDTYRPITQFYEDDIRIDQFLYSIIYAASFDLGPDKNMTCPDMLCVGDAGLKGWPSYVPAEITKRCYEGLGFGKYCIFTGESEDLYDQMDSFADQ